jgi:DNA polymerase elongation subunit (family B)
MSDTIQLENILFLDIETVPQYPDHAAVPEKIQKLWEKKAERLKPAGSPETTAETLYPRASIYAEFGKIVCISVGTVKNQKIYIKSFASDDEHALLTDFAAMLEKSFNGKEHFLCAHNGKEFDFPYICRRMLIQGIRLPAILDIAGKKPWEVMHHDTMEFWKFGDYKNYTSLELLAAVFDIPTPKDDIDGSEVYKVYWHDQDLPRIVTYCQKDVVTIIQLFRRYRGLPLIPEEQVVIVG